MTKDSSPIIDEIDRRKKLGATQAELARDFGVSQSSISRILAGEEVSMKTLKRLADSASCAGSISEPDESARIFAWYKRRGLLINPSDNTRNVSFKVETFDRLLQTLVEGIGKHLGPTDDTLETIRDILFQAGYDSGSRFGWTMHELYQRHAQPLTIEEKINRWCDFDSDVGFGRLAIVDKIKTSNTRSPERLVIVKFVLRVTDNFLVYKKESTDVNLCPFMTGYVRGVLEKILGQPLNVEHRHQHCAQFVVNQEFCDFDVATNRELLDHAIEAARTRIGQP